MISGQENSEETSEQEAKLAKLNEKQEPQEPIQQIVNKLQQLSEQIQNSSQHPFDHLKSYFIIYVQNHKRSDEFFNLMCEHNMLAKLFSTISRPIYTLEIFNLLLANTQQTSELVYIFSHPLFHSYLLINVQGFLQITTASTGQNLGSSTASNSECIQYYIQLIKTLVMKLQAESHECILLKLFCNCKYPDYPLLANCIFLALKRNIKQELVRVTAQHCILQLVGIMARKKIGEFYFYNLHMLIFFYQIISETIAEETFQFENQDTTIKYLVDLLKAINLSVQEQIKQKAFLLFFTIFSNLLLFKSPKNPASALNLLLKLSRLFSEIQQLQDFSSKYLTPIYFILGKLIFNKYLNNITLSSIILMSEDISSLSKLNNVNILKIIRNQYQKNFTKFAESSDNFSAIFQFKNSRLKLNKNSFDGQFQRILHQIDKYNLDNEEFLHLKQSFYKNSSNSENFFIGISNFFLKKINVLDIANGQYIKRICRIASIKYIKEQPIKFLDETSVPSAIYIYEYLKIKSKGKYLFGQKAEDTQKNQISFNENRDQFQADSEFFKIILKISCFVLHQIDSIERSKERIQLIQILQKSFNSKLFHPGQVYFVLHFRQYFQNSIFQYVCTSSLEKPKTFLSQKIVFYLYNIAAILQLTFSQMNKNKLRSQILKLQKQLQNIRKQKGTQQFFEYLQSNKEKQMVQQAIQINKNSKQSSEYKSSRRLFDNNEELFFDDHQKTNSKKKISISKPLKSKTDSFSKTKFQTHSTSKIIEIKMLHLQLLRFLQGNSDCLLKKSYDKERSPFFIAVEQKFVNKYFQICHSSTEELLYQMSGIQFNFEADYKCTLRIIAYFEGLNIFCELFHQQKRILKCNIQDFNLSEPYQEINNQGPANMSIEESLDDPKDQLKFVVLMLPTSNTLAFRNRKQFNDFHSRMTQIKSGFREIKISALNEYLNIEE